MWISLLDFFRSRSGKTVLFVILVLTLVYFVREHNERKALRAGAAAERTFKPDDRGRSAGQALTSETEQGESIDRKGNFSRFKPPAMERPGRVAMEEAAVQKMEPVKVDARLALRPLVHGYSEPERDTASVRRDRKGVDRGPVIAVGTLIPCRLVQPLETGGKDTPIIARTTATIPLGKGRVIAMGAEVFGSAGGRVEGSRVMTGGNWELHAADSQTVSLKGVALNRDYDSLLDRYGLTDGVLGIEGEESGAESPLEWKKLAATGLGAVSRFSQHRRRTLLGDEITNSIRNGALEGVSELSRDYARELERENPRGTAVIRVPAGKEFYLYVEAGRQETQGGDAAISDALRQREAILETLKSRLGNPPAP